MNSPLLERWALLLEYDGTSFVGWQRQATGVTVQRVLEGAVMRLGGPARSTAAGRTDTGVHATGQVALVELPASIGLRQVAPALSFHMRPHPVVILRAAPAAPGWSPRFSATGRAYRFTILNRPAPPMLLRNRVWHVDRPLDTAAMHDAATALLGQHDFTSFRAAACQANSPCRTLDVLTVTRNGDAITIAAEARSFLHHQVRNMVGTLKLVGQGTWTRAAVVAALHARSRAAAGPTAPPQGLTLTAVRYPADPFAIAMIQPGTDATT